MKLNWMGWVVGQLLAPTMLEKHIKCIDCGELHEPIKKGFGRCGNCKGVCIDCGERPPYRSMRRCGPCARVAAKSPTRTCVMCGDTYERVMGVKTGGRCPECVAIKNERKAELEAKRLAEGDQNLTPAKKEAAAKREAVVEKTRANAYKPPKENPDA